MIKVIHAADVHLDSPFRMEDLQKAQARKNELRAAFSSLIYWAKTENADFLLIAGDLFDSPHPTPDAVDFVLSQFRLIPSCRIIITPGNHDYVSSDSVWAKYTMPENVTLFTKSTLSSKKFTLNSGDIVNVYGYAFTSPILDYNPFSKLTLEKSDEINLIVAHGNLGGDKTKDCPISLAEIRQTGADYIALGHIHNTPGIKKVDNTYFGYSGSLEGRAFNDRGERGAYKIEISKQNGVATCRPAFFRLCKRIYAMDSLNLTGTQSYDDAVQAIAELIKTKGYGSDTLLRLELTGSLSPDVDLSAKKIQPLMASLFYCEIIDHTSPDFDIEDLKEDPTIKGELVRTLIPALESEDEEMRRCARRALKYGLSALTGNDVSDF